VTTDLSPESQSAFSVAVSLSSHYNAAVTLLSCIDSTPQFSEFGLSTIDAPLISEPEDLNKIRESLNRSLERVIASEFKAAAVRYQVIEATMPVKYSILKYIEETSPDLVVMASHGRSGFARFVLGSVAEFIMRRSNKATLIVPVAGREDRPAI
jgi:nucleotide-binding universal stress UspA family protein